MTYKPSSRIPRTWKEWAWERRHTACSLHKFMTEFRAERFDGLSPMAQDWILDRLGDDGLDVSRNNLYDVWDADYGPGVERFLEIINQYEIVDVEVES